MSVEARARLSLGASSDSVYRMVGRALEKHAVSGSTLLDVGGGGGDVWPYVGRHFKKYVCVDAVRYGHLAPETEFVQIDLDAGKVPLQDGSADAVMAIETIEHLENPRAFMRELTRLVKPGGWIIVTTPNQLSLLSLFTLLFKRQFQAFQATDYPAHITALLEVDLVRIARECCLQVLEIMYSHKGRIVFTSKQFPQALAKRFPRALSDNVLLIGRKEND